MRLLERLMPAELTLISKDCGPPDGPAETVSGKRHCGMNMYTAVAKDGVFKVVARSRGFIDPKECLQRRYSEVRDTRRHHSGECLGRSRKGLSFPS